MTLNIEVKGNPASIRATGYWLNQAKFAVDAAGTAAFGARADSTVNWGGDAGDGFRAVMTKLGGFADGLATKVNSTGAGLVTFGGELQVVKNQMASGRQVAVTGGLTTTATMIMPPGPAPQPAGTLPPNATPEQKSANASAVAAQTAYAKKVQAYKQAAAIVAGARRLEQTAQRKLGAGPLKDLATVTDLGVGAAVGASQVNSKLRVAYARFDSAATTAARLTNNTTMSAAGRAQALRILADRAIQAEQYRVAAESNLVARFGATQPQWVKNLLQKPLVGGIPKDTPPPVRPTPPPGRALPGWLKVINGGVKLGRGIPLLGLGLAVAGVGIDIANGTDPGKAIASGAAGFAGGLLGGAIGAAAGFAVGGPVGAVVGGIGGGVLVGSVASGAVEQVFFS